MPNTIKSTGETAKKYYNPKMMYFRPFVNGTPGTNYYKMQNVVRNTTSITQDDNESNIIDDEFTSAPIINNVDTGAYKFVTEVADFQEDILVNFAGFKKGTSGKIYAPAGYTEIYVEIALVFDSGDSEHPLMAAVLPKVQLDSKTIIESLNDNIGRVTINGTGHNLAVNDGEGISESPFYFDPAYVEPSAGA